MDSAAGDGEKKRRRWWPWLLIAAILVAATWIAVAATGRDEFAFLDKYNPLRIVGPTYKTGNRRVVLVFPKTTAGKVLPALNRSLRPPAWQRRAWGPPGEEEISFSSSGRLVEYGGLLGGSLTQGVPGDPNEFHYEWGEGECAVDLIRPSTWFDRQFDAVKGWLHLR